MRNESMRARIQEYKSQNIRARVVAGLQGKSVFCSQLDSCIYEFTEIVAARTEPELNKSR